ncbi:hypothetical protein GCM10027566_29890 [Arachidicoccus ginsenosidivorans]|jgi:transcriptional regulator with XRE-family HTH domain|uniref:Helix-turn-helix transcriptional regulator n=1 Tax=Arachidicoccus ginsenosidivorans TaxID=496057 RepID=A0A5B8VMJ4_9BACT|nr:helix-turn-helix transcriptional regulator [Arachidicoccus ginsenosidivorans]QEC72794.1 helix-turn-helix transcriptional regulator [Arachidicoccus ginsenosidivorans]
MTLEEIGKEITSRRKELEITQQDLGEMAEVTTKTISQIENGTGNPSFQTLEKIMEILGMKIIIMLKVENL